VRNRQCPADGLSPYWVINAAPWWADQALVTRSVRFALSAVAALSLAACGPFGSNGDEELLQSSTRVNSAEAAPGGLARADETSWSYGGNTGPADWGKLTKDWETCASGREQSPIDLSKGAKYKVSGQGDDSPGVSGAPAERRIELRYQPASYTAVDLGHALRLQLADAGSMVIDDVPYALQELRFHTPSEHTLGGVRYPGELQLVHRAEAGDVAIMAVMIQSGKANATLQPVLDHLPEAGKPEQGGVALDVATLVPENWTMARYNGSLTEPPCTEQVRWHVLLSPQQMSPEQLGELSGGYPDNARPVQPDNGRPVMVEIDTVTGVVEP